MILRKTIFYNSWTGGVGQQRTDRSRRKGPGAGLAHPRGVRRQEPAQIPLVTRPLHRDGRQDLSLFGL